MDVLDAGVFVSRWEAAVPRDVQTVLWGPLQARELGLEGWEVQDGGETGFVVHNPGVKLVMGRATSTLVFVRRLKRAYLAVYFGGYPADAPAQQRRLDMQKVVSSCELFLSRLCRDSVRFELKEEVTLVDNLQAARSGTNGTHAPPTRGPMVGATRSVEGAGTFLSQPPRSRADASGGPRARAEPAAPGPGAPIEDGEPVPRRVDSGGGAEVWEV